MKPTTRHALIIVLGLITVGVVVAVVLLGSGGFFGNTSTHPPCDQLPTSAQVEKALQDHPDLAGQLRALDPEVQVGVGRPCTIPADAALVQVSYRTGDQERAIQELLSRANGFGVPVHLVRA